MGDEWAEVCGAYFTKCPAKVSIVLLVVEEHVHLT